MLYVVLYILHCYSTWQYLHLAVCCTNDTGKNNGHPSNVTTFSFLTNSHKTIITISNSLPIRIIITPFLQPIIHKAVTLTRSSHKSTTVTRRHTWMIFRRRLAPRLSFIIWRIVSAYTQIHPNTPEYTQIGLAWTSSCLEPVQIRYVLHNNLATLALGWHSIDSGH